MANLMNIDADTLLVARDLAEEGRVAEATQMLLANGAPDLDSAVEALAPVGAVGQILVCSWGYDQTNIDFYQVVKASRTMVTVRKLYKRTVRNDQYTVQVVPVPGAFETDSPVRETTFRRKIVEGGRYSRWGCSIASYSSAHLWNGEPASETGWAYGH